MLKLVGFILIFNNESVEETMTSDLEFSGVRLAVFLDSSRYRESVNKYYMRISLHRYRNVCIHWGVVFCWLSRTGMEDLHEASFRRHISINCLISDTSEGILIGCRSTNLLRR